MYLLLYFWYIELVYCFIFYGYMDIFKYTIELVRTLNTYYFFFLIIVHVCLILCLKRAQVSIYYNRLACRISFFIMFLYIMYIKSMLNILMCCIILLNGRNI